MSTQLHREAALHTYYENRNPRSLSVTEFGHNIYPICLTANALTTPYERYTGIETWYRGGSEAKSRLEDKLRTVDGSKTDNYNRSIRFITHDSGITIHREGSDRWQEGSYTPYSSSELGHEDEVIASNLFGDPDIAESIALTQTLLAQMAEITRPNGLIVLRETITPERVRPFSKAFLGEIGLKGYMTYKTTDSPLWKRLESIYDGSKAKPLSAKSLYIFLQKSLSPDDERNDSLQSPNQQHSTML